MMQKSSSPPVGLSIHELWSVKAWQVALNFPQFLNSSAYGSLQGGLIHQVCSIEWPRYTHLNKPRFLFYCGLPHTMAEIRTSSLKSILGTTLARFYRPYIQLSYAHYVITRKHIKGTWGRHPSVLRMVPSGEKPYGLRLRFWKMMESHQ